MCLLSREEKGRGRKQVQEREEREERESLCVVQPKGYLLRPTPLDKTLSERHRDSEGEVRNGRKIRQDVEGLFSRLPPSYYSFHLDCLNKDPLETVHRMPLLSPISKRAAPHIPKIS